MVVRDAAPGTELEVVLCGDFPPGAYGRACEMVAGLASEAGVDLQHARVRLTNFGDARQRPVIAQMTAEVAGRRLRAQVHGTTPQVAIDLLADVLRHRLTRLRQHHAAGLGHAPGVAPHEWHHAIEHDPSTSDVPSAADQAESSLDVVRHKTFRLVRCTPDEAIEDMELMGYPFRLFTDLQSNQDSIVYRTRPAGYRLMQVKPEPGRVRRSAAALTTSPYPAPRLHPAEAIERLRMTGWPFLFYTDPLTGRGRVLYRRHEGNLGLITANALDVG